MINRLGWGRNRARCSCQDDTETPASGPVTGRAWDGAVEPAADIGLGKLLSLNSLLAEGRMGRCKTWTLSRGDLGGTGIQPKTMIEPYLQYGSSLAPRRNAVRQRVPRRFSCQDAHASFYPRLFPVRDAAADSFRRRQPARPVSKTDQLQPRRTKFRPIRLPSPTARQS